VVGEDEKRGLKGQCRATGILTTENENPQGALASDVDKKDFLDEDLETSAVL
jgi:hypothetical protein